MSNRHQLWDASLIGPCDQPNWIRPLAQRFPLGVQASRTLVPKRFADRSKLGSRVVSLEG
jgi:hypothetical protein